MAELMNTGRQHTTTTAEADVSATVTPTVTVSLPPLPDLPNPEKLQEIKAAELKEPKDFRQWKNSMMAEFEYYGIDGIIDGTYGLPVGATKLQYWRVTERLFIQAFASTVPPSVYEDVKNKKTLREKWLAILEEYTHTDLGKITNDLFNIKFEVKETLGEFIVRLLDTWENLARCGHKVDATWKIEQLLSKLESTFPNKTRELRRTRDVRPITWEYAVKVYKDVEHTRPTAQSTGGSGAALSVTNPQKPKDSHSRFCSPSRSRSSDC